MRRVLLLSSVIVLVLSVAPLARATSGTLVVVSDMTLTANHYGNIVIDADNVTLDCAGHKVLGPGTFGFNGGIEVIGGHSGVTVRRCYVSGFTVNGIFAGPGSPGGRYEANTVVNNADHGIGLDGAAGDVVVANTTRSNGGIGIVLTEATQTRIKGNVAQGNSWAGIALFASSVDNVVVNNTTLRNGLGFVIETSYSNDLHGNTANANEAAGFRFLNGANTNSVNANTSNGNGLGFEITEASSSNLLTNNVAHRNLYDGFKIYASNGNTLSLNTANENGGYGFVLFGGSSNNTISGNVAHVNAVFDAYDEGTGTGNVWNDNVFGTTSGI